MTLLFMPIGDSLIFGTGSTTPSTDSVGAVLGRQWIPGATTVVDGHPGNKVSDLLTTITAPNNASGSYDARLAFVAAGTNDVLQSVATATTLANLATLKSTLEGCGFSGTHGAIVWATLPYWVGYSTGAGGAAFDAINAWAKTQAWWVDLAATPEWALAAGGTDYDGTYRLNLASGVNAGHGTTLGYACWARDAARTMLLAAHSIGWG